MSAPSTRIRFMGKAWDGAEIEEAARKNRRDVSRHTRLTGSPDSPNRKLIARTGSAFQTKAGEAGSYDFTVTGNRAFQEWCEAWASEALRVLKPGGHALVFGGTRTYHRLASGMEDAGFEIRDCIAWLFGSGFPKSLDVSKAIDKAAGAEREVVGSKLGRPGYSLAEDAGPGGVAMEGNVDRSLRDAVAECEITAPATPEAERWRGWGTALKPAHEPIVVARKPLSGTVSANVQEFGTGALNVDGCRVEGPGWTKADGESGAGYKTDKFMGANGRGEPTQQFGERSSDAGRWPANVILDEQAAEVLDEQTGERPSGKMMPTQVRSGDRTVFGQDAAAGYTTIETYGDTGGASRFFYTPKASRAERNAGLDAFEKKPLLWSSGEQSPGTFQAEGTEREARNAHPTVKPIDLMRWLVRLVTPLGGVVLNPFLGSGTTGIAAALEGFEFIGIEREADYLAIAEARIAFWREHGEEGLAIVRGREAAERVRAEIVASGQLDLLAEVP